MYTGAEAFKHHLAMNLTEKDLRLAIIDPETKKILYHEVHTFISYDKDGIKPILEQDIFRHEFANHSLSAGNDRSTLIPSELFGHSKPKDIFALNFTSPIDNLDYNRIPELGMVNIYEIPLWIKSLFVIRFPRVRIIHPSTVLIKGVFNRPTFSPKVHLHIADKRMHLLITDKNKLQFSNQFNYQEFSDLVYYVLYALEQNQLNQEDLKICLYGVDRSWEHLEEFKQFFKARLDLDLSPKPAENYLLSKHVLCA